MSINDAINTFRSPPGFLIDRGDLGARSSFIDRLKRRLWKFVRFHSSDWSAVHNSKQVLGGPDSKRQVRLQEATIRSHKHRGKKLRISKINDVNWTSCLIPRFNICNLRCTRFSAYGVFDRRRQSAKFGARRPKGDRKA